MWGLLCLEGGGREGGGWAFLSAWVSLKSQADMVEQAGVEGHVNIASEILGGSCNVLCDLGLGVCRPSKPKTDASIISPPVATCYSRHPRINLHETGTSDRPHTPGKDHTGPIKFLTICKNIFTEYLGFKNPVCLIFLVGQNIIIGTSIIKA